MLKQIMEDFLNGKIEMLMMHKENEKVIIAFKDKNGKGIFTLSLSEEKTNFNNLLEKW